MTEELKTDDLKTDEVDKALSEDVKDASEGSASAGDDKAATEPGTVPSPHDEGEPEVSEPQAGVEGVPQGSSGSDDASALPALEPEAEKESEPVALPEAANAPAEVKEEEPEETTEAEEPKEEEPVAEPESEDKGEEGKPEEAKAEAPAEEAPSAPAAPAKGPYKGVSGDRAMLSQLGDVQGDRLVALGNDTHSLLESARGMEKGDMDQDTVAMLEFLVNIGPLWLAALERLLSR